MMSCAISLLVSHLFLQCSIGTRVLVYFDNGNSWLPGKVTKVNRTTYTFDVFFDCDGTTETDLSFALPNITIVECAPSPVLLYLEWWGFRIKLAKQKIYEVQSCPYPDPCPQSCVLYSRFSVFCSLLSHLFNPIYDLFSLFLFSLFDPCPSSYPDPCAVQTLVQALTRFASTLAFHNKEPDLIRGMCDSMVISKS